MKWVHVVYLHGKDIWQQRNGRDDPPIFKNLFKLRNLLINKTGYVQNSITLLSSQQNQIKFSSLKAYNWIRPMHESKPWMNLIWRTYIPPKHSFILWLACRGRLNTMNNWISFHTDGMSVFLARNIKSPFLIFSSNVHSLMLFGGKYVAG